VGPRVARFSSAQFTKNRKNIPNYRIIYQKTLNILNCRKIDQVAIKYTNIFRCKTLQNLTKLRFFISKYAIWQPRWDHFFTNASGHTVSPLTQFRVWVLHCWATLVSGTCTSTLSSWWLATSPRGPSSRTTTWDQFYEALFPQKNVWKFYLSVYNWQNLIQNLQIKIG
jgi:hypothetical protein